MNRLVIIGNGFDLAHKLPTGYCDFINDYWLDVIKTISSNTHRFEDELFNANIDYLEQSHILCNDWKLVKDYESLFTFFNKYDNHFYNTKSFSFQNELFRTISNQTATHNWVDIENIYYEILKSRAKGVNNKYSYAKNVYDLHAEFDQIKRLLKKYLVKKIKDIYRFDHYSGENTDWSLMCEKLKPISIFSNEDNIRKQFSKIDDVNDIEIFFKKERDSNEKAISNIYFLTFNYTPTIYKYSDLIKSERIAVFVNYIHGEIENEHENKINFGFGDEMDDDYKSIENMNNNEYLRNFKSFQYLQNSNYNNLLNFIDSEKFQTVIVGHSCGLSDRTLLNTIFEHRNCRSIKVFFHEIKDEKGNVIADNYTEITQNISRHFNKKALMRERIVNKTLCQPLPQIQLPKKQNDPL